MTRERRIELLAQELERVPSGELPPNSAALIADMRAGNLGPGFEAALRAMQRVAEESKQ